MRLFTRLFRNECHTCARHGIQENNVAGQIISEAALLVIFGDNRLRLEVFIRMIVPTLSTLLGITLLVNQVIWSWMG